MYHQLHDPAFLAVASGGTPALDLFFSATKALDSRITFSRGSSATFINSSGLVETAASGVARFTHNPSTLASLGLLIEESRTNLLVRSEEFDNASWSQSNITVSANATSSPDGILNADKVVENTTTSIHRILTTISRTSGTTYTLSVFAKAAGRTLLFVNAGSAIGAQSTFNLANGTVSATASGTASIVSLAGGWYRCSVTGTATATGITQFFFQVNNTVTAATDDSYLGDGTSGILLWGAQLEAGAFATSYIPTTSATVTRAADVATMTGTNFSSWFNATEGTFAVSAQPLDITTATLFTADDNGVNNRIYIQRESSSSIARGAVATSGSTVASLGISGVSTTLNAALAYKQNDFAFSANGSSVVTDTAGNLPTVDRLRLGVAPVGGFGMFGPISRIRYYRRRLPNANLQTLTT